VNGVLTLRQLNTY